MSETISDGSKASQTGLPLELRHENILLHRKTGEDTELGGRAAYQIVFDQPWMPYDYDIPDGWYMVHARTEFHKTATTVLGKIRELFGGERPCTTIVLIREIELAVDPPSVEDFRSFKEFGLVDDEVEE